MSYRPIFKNRLERIAKETRQTYGKFDGKRLLVENLVEQLGFQLIPRIGLREELGIEAYLPKRLNTIIVDQDSFDNGTPRYYFTLAEEIAHSLIHLQGPNRDTLYRWITSLSKRDYENLERDAKYLAGALLMPRVEFITLFHQHSSVQKKALGVHGDPHTIIRYTIRKLYMAYCVSFEAAAFRALNLNLISPHDITLLGRYRPTAFSHFNT